MMGGGSALARARVRRLCLWRARTRANSRRAHSCFHIAHTCIHHYSHSIYLPGPRSSDDGGGGASGSTPFAKRRAAAKAPTALLPPPPAELVAEMKHLLREAAKTVAALERKSPNKAAAAGATRF